MISLKKSIDRSPWTGYTCTSGGFRAVNSHQMDVDSLRTNMRGTVLMPEDAGYDRVRVAWNPILDQHPSVVTMEEEAEPE